MNDIKLVSKEPDPLQSQVSMGGAAERLLLRHRVLLLVALAALIYVLWLGRRDLWYPDEPDIAEVTRAMFVSGDWIRPRHHGQIWVDYPPMLYWAGSISSQLLGGMSEFALRLPSALAAIGLVVVTCAAGSRWFDRRTGLWAGLVLLTSSQFVWQAIGYRPDILFSLFIGLGLFVYAGGVGERARWGPRVAGFALLGLAFLTKGPLGLLLPGLVLTLWHGARREWRWLFELAPLTLVALAVALPWYVACARAMGAEKFLQELYLQNFMRFSSGFRGHGRPFYYYVTMIWVDIAPWVLLLPFALWYIVRAKLWRERYVQLALWWGGAFLVFLSIAVTKRQLYLLPAFPAVALLLAPWLSTVGRTETAAGPPDPRPARAFIAVFSIVLVVSAVVAFGAAAAIGTIVARLEIEALYRQIVLGLRAPVLALGATGIAVGLWVWHARRRGDVPGALYRLAVANVLICLVVVAGLIPTFNPAKTYVPQCRWILEQIGSETRIGLVNLWHGNKKRGAFAYYTGLPVDLLETGDEIERFFQAHPRSLVLVYKGVADAFFASEKTDWRARVVRELVAGNRRYIVLRDS